MLIINNGKYVCGVRAAIPPDIWVVCHGDSITAGTGETPYPAQLGALVDAGQNIHAGSVNYGVGGISWDYDWPFESQIGTLTSNAPDTVDPFLARAQPSWLVAFAGTNGMSISLGEHTAAQEYADFEVYMADRITAGWDPDMVVIPTMLPRNGFDETKRTDYNALLVSGAATYGYRVARLDLNTTIGEAGDQANTTYYRDGVHPTTAGAAIIAQVIYETMYP